MRIFVSQIIFCIKTAFHGIQSTYIANQDMQEYFLDLFQDYDKEVNPLNWVVHRSEQYQLPAKDLIDFPRKGLLSLINFFIL